eukprot:scaffold212_cov173-Amphora_coffeaeformis.AAC.6
MQLDFPGSPIQVFLQFGWSQNGRRVGRHMGLTAFLRKTFISQRPDCQMVILMPNGVRSKFKKVWLKVHRPDDK